MVDSIDFISVYGNVLNLKFILLRITCYTSRTHYMLFTLHSCYVHCLYVMLWLLYRLIYTYGIIYLIFCMLRNRLLKPNIIATTNTFYF